MPLPERFTLTPAARPRGGLLSAARPIGGEWWRGVTFTTPSCTAPQVMGACNDGMPQVEKDYQRPSAAANFQSYTVLQAIECTVTATMTIRALAEQSLDVTREFAVARELLAGAASGNPNLGDATVLTGAATPAEALGCLDQYAAELLAGRLAFIHASPAIGTAWLAAHAIERDGLLWRTALGSVVVISAGYDGREPGGAPPSGGDTLWAYVTGEVYAEVGLRETQQSIDRTVDTAQAWTEEAAIAVFDPCFVAAIDTTVTLCGVAP